MLVRNAMFRRVELAARRRWIDLADLDAEAGGLDQDAWQDGIEEYFDEHDHLGTGPDARGPQMLQIEEQAGQWLVRQVHPAGDHDWGITAVVDLAASDEAGEAVVRTTGFEPL